MADELQLPNLAPQTYREIFASLRDAIPTFSSNWTDYNLSDPGITILGLLAFIAQATYYRIDRVTDASYHNYLLLAAGTPEEGVEDALDKAERDVVRQNGKQVLLGGEPVPLDPLRIALLRYLRDSRKKPKNLSEMRAQGLAYWPGPYRAVTAADFEALALQATADVPLDTPTDRVFRARATQDGDRVILTLVSGWVPEYVVLDVAPGDPGVVAGVRFKPQLPSSQLWSGYSKLVTVLLEYLAPRRLVGTPLTVRPVTYVPTAATVQVALALGEDPRAVLTAAGEKIVALVDPLSGGLDGKGWPIDRPLTSDDLISALDGFPGVDSRQPISAEVEQLYGTRVGAALVGRTTAVGSPPDPSGLPWLTTLILQALTSTWTLEVGVHSRIAIDTRIPFSSDGGDA